MAQDIKENKKIGRLKKRADFLLLNQKGERWVTPSFALQALYKKTDHDYQVGFTATKKFSKRAVDRNRAKRRLRALVSEMLLTHAKSEHIYVLIAREDILTIEYAQMKKDLKWALKRLNCLKD